MLSKYTVSNITGTMSAENQPAVTSSPSFAEVAGASPVSEGSLTAVHSNYVPAQMEKHLQFLDINANGDLIVGASSLTTRYWTGSLWYFKKGVMEEDITNPEMCLTGVDLETGVLDGKFVQDEQMVLGLDSGGVVMVTLTKEQDGDRVTHYLEQQSAVVEHEDILTGLDVWEMDHSVATVGADQRLNIFSPSLALVHTFHPAHARFISSVACSSLPSILATASREGSVRVWDTRQARPARTVYRNEIRPPSCITWSGEQEIVVGSSTGDLMVVDTRGKGTENLYQGQIFDREVTRMSWSPDRSRLAVVGNDVKVVVVKVKVGQMEVELEDSRHTDYVRGLAWSGPGSLLSAGWDHKVLSHQL